VRVEPRAFSKAAEVVGKAIPSTTKAGVTDAADAGGKNSVVTA
jgi:hypothetical protein